MDVADQPTRADLGQLLDRGFRYALALTHNEMKAEDLVQEACMRMMKKNIPWQASYFFTTIRNYFIELFRHDNRFPSIQLDSVNEKTLLREHNLRDSESIVADTESLEKALAHLKTEEREILFLFVIEGYTAAEIAKIIDCPRNTVLSIIHRARKKLRRRLEKEHAEVLP